MSDSQPLPSIMAEIATALPWPPAEPTEDTIWCAHCDFPLSATAHHRCCLGYIVGAPDLPLCSCPCNEPRRLAAAQRRPDPFYDRPRWWQVLEADRTTVRRGT
ncbi:hypothetical protein [Streptacidiphilus rugosus]|uniref:hypothetical protein n=1 Tax=Streptacidiphilus rugosus TaxID=405783 RepID=UPI00056A8CBB|nr:hypothetical protein [Streptacidiphilus rugosus]